jgi:hypothetical protein
MAGFDDAQPARRKTKKTHVYAKDLDVKSAFSERVYEYAPRAGTPAKIVTENFGEEDGVEDPPKWGPRASPFVCIGLLRDEGGDGKLSR